MFHMKIGLWMAAITLGILGGLGYLLHQDLQTQAHVMASQYTQSSARGAFYALRQAEVSLLKRAEYLSQWPHLIEKIQNLREEMHALLQKYGTSLSELMVALKKNKARKALWQTLMDYKRNEEGKLGHGVRTVEDREELFELQVTQEPQHWLEEVPSLLLVFEALGKGDQALPILVAYGDAQYKDEAGQKPGPFEKVVQKAWEQKRASIDVVDWNKCDYLIAAVPVIQSEQVLAVIIVGTPFEKTLASRLSAFLPKSQTVFLSYGKRLHGDQPDPFLKGVFHQVVLKKQEMIFKDKALRHDALEQGHYQVFAHGKKYWLHRIVLNDLPSFQEHKPSLEVYTTMEEMEAPMHALTWLLVLAGILFVSAFLALVLMVLKTFTKPLLEIDEGIQAILKGDRDYIFDIQSNHPLLEELGLNLNQLVDFLQGKDGDSSGHWQTLPFQLSSNRPSFYGMKAVEIISNADEKKKLKELYEEYIRERKKLGQKVDMDFDRFVRRLKRNEEKLKKKHQCSAVEFRVSVMRDKVVLKPKIIK